MTVDYYRANHGELLLRYYRALLDRFGPRKWWPAQTPFEVCVGAVLTQNTAWKNVSKAIDNLKAASALDPVTLYQMSHEDLAGLIRPAGYFNVKAKRLKHFMAYLMEEWGGDLHRMFSQSQEHLRSALLEIHGVGKETADSIILYAAGMPIFVVDAYTRRVLQRHALINEKADYDEIQDLFHRNLARDTALFNDFHAQIVAVGHHYCKKKPRCDDCPLREFLPPVGP